MRQTAQEAGGEQPVLVGGEGGERVARDEEAHQGDEDLAAGHPGGGRGEQQGADDDAERVRGDQVSGGRDGYVQVVRDVGQQAHHGELGGADAEGAHGEGEQGQRHEGPFGERGRAGLRTGSGGHAGTRAGTAAPAHGDVRGFADHGSVE